MFGQFGQAPAPQGEGFGLGQQLPGLPPMAAAMMGQGQMGQVQPGQGQSGMAGMLAQLGPLLAQMQQGQQPQAPQPMPGQLPIAGQGMQGQMGLPAMTSLQQGYMAQGGGIAPQRKVVGA